MTPLQTLTAALERMSERVHRNDAAQVAQKWIDAGFGYNTQPWWDAGIWCLATASRLRSIGITPDNRRATEFANALCSGDLKIDDWIGSCLDDAEQKFGDSSES